MWRSFAAAESATTMDCQEADQAFQTNESLITLEPILPVIRSKFERTVSKITIEKFIYSN